MVSAFLNGEVDEIQSSEAVVIDQVKAAGFENYTAASANNYSTTFCLPNTSDEASPWADDKLRTAVFHHGIDWNGVANILTNGLGSATTQWGVTGALNFDDNITVSYTHLQPVLFQAGVDQLVLFAKGYRMSLMV